MKAGQKLWTRDELILVINLYCKLPFGRLHNRNPEVINLASLIGRTPSSVAYKLVNFASLDPSLRTRGIKGAENASNLDKKIWNEFFNNWDDLPYESEKLVAKFKKTTVEALNNIPTDDLPKVGKVREALIKVRVNQAFFRSTILASYNGICCVTGMKHSEFLIAAHIRPWGIDERNRLNPRNGILINALHDRAFESGLMTITPDYVIKISPTILSKERYSIGFFKKFDGKKIIAPSRFLPDPEFLRYHNRERYKH